MPNSFETTAGTLVLIGTLILIEVSRGAAAIINITPIKDCSTQSPLNTVRTSANHDRQPDSAPGPSLLQER